MRFELWLLLFAVTNTLVYSQDCAFEVRGKVIDFHQDISLVGAEIAVYQDSATEPLYTVNSDEDGTYILRNLCAGDYTFVISHPDCKTVSQELSLKGNKIFDFTLEHHYEQLKEVKVRGNRQRNETRTAQEVQLNQELLEQYSSGSLGDALREVPGISSLNTGVNIVKPSIHGLIGSRVLILDNGVRMQDMEWGDEHAPNVDLNAVGNVTIVKGAASLRYGGDALGGIILLQPEQVNIDDPGFSGKALISMQSNGRGGSVSNSFSRIFRKGWYAQLQGSFKLLGDSESPDYILSNTGIQQGAASVRFGKQELTRGVAVNYKFYEAEIGILRASHIGNVDDLIRSINSGQPEVIEPFTYDINNPRQRVTHHTGRLSYYRRFKQFGRLDMSYDFQLNQRQEFDIRVGDDRDKAALDLELTTHTAQIDLKSDKNPQWTWETGILGRYQDNFANPDTGVRRLIPDYQRFEAGAYWTNAYSWKDAHTLDAGIRYDYSRIDAKKFYRTSRWEERGYQSEFGDLIIEDLGNQLLVNPIFDFHNLSWSTGYQYKPDNQNEFRFNFTWARRAPNPSELFSDGLHHSAARIELGDLRLVSEKSKKLSLSWKYQKEQWSLSIDPYFHLVDDFILLEPTEAEVTIRGAFPVWDYRQSDVLITGVDVELRRQWHPNWSSNHQFSYLYGQDQSRDIPLINMPPGTTKHSIEWSLPKWHGFRMEVKGEYYLKQTRTPENIFVFSAAEQADVLLKINDAPPAFALLSARASWNWKLPQGGIQLSLSGSNLFNNSYRNYLNRQRFFADDLGRNVQIQLKFNY